MKYLVRQAEMKRYDANTQDYFGMPPLVLIERAALSAVEEMERAGMARGTVLVACGTGNNGADGLAIARLLFLRGVDARIIAVGERGRATPENEREYEIAGKYGIPIIAAEEFLRGLCGTIDGTDPSFSPGSGGGRALTVVDAIFGVGLSRPVGGAAGELIGAFNRMDAARVACDVPSGIDSDSGAVLGAAFRADLTVTFSFEKLGMRLYPGQEYCGRIVCRDAGIDAHSFLSQADPAGAPAVLALTDGDLAGLPERKPRSNKGTYGKALVIAGSVGMAGAAYFCARAAYLSGCGLVRVFTPEENREIIQNALPEALLTPYDAKKIENSDEEQINTLLAAMRHADAVVCGPGLGTGGAARTIVGAVLKNAAAPLVLDADALNIMADTDGLPMPRGKYAITPHPGEMARLLRSDVPRVLERTVGTAEAFARERRAICVLKDARTVTALPDGRIYVNLSGNDGMATAGSGDVLSGVITGLAAQGMKLESAAPMGVYIHGLAGDIAARKRGRRGMTASSILEALPEVLLRAEEKEHF